MSKVEFKIGYCLGELAKIYAEYGPIIDKVRIVRDNRQETTMWINPHLEMGFNESFCDRLTLKQLENVVLHELRHVEYGHFTRETSVRRVYGNGYLPIVHNVAQDLEINSKISGLPESGCFPKDFGYEENLTYEQYFQKIIKDPKFDKKINIFVLSKDQGGLGKNLPNDLCFDHINKCEDVRNKSSSDDVLSSEDENFLDDLKKEIEETSKQKGLGQGEVTGTLKVKPTKPIDILNYVRIRCSNIKNEKTFGYDRINYNAFKSSTLPDIVFFKTYNEIVPISLAFIIDVSGSRTDDQINNSISKIWSTLENIDDITFIIDIFFADDGVTQVNRVTKRSEIPKTFKGRGGTRLSTAYTTFKTKYDLIVVMTDGFCDYSEINNLEKKFFDRTVVGIDKESYLQTYQQFTTPTFIL